MLSWSLQRAKAWSGSKDTARLADSAHPLYNALPIESVQALIDCMNEFEKAMHNNNIRNRLKKIL